MNAQSNVSNYSSISVDDCNSLRRRFSVLHTNDTYEKHIEASFNILEITSNGYIYD
jgi:hypothetical protein